METTAQVKVTSAWPLWRRVAVGCVIVSALGLVAGFVLPGPLTPGDSVGFAAVLRAIPLLATACGLLAGLLCVLATGQGTPVSTPLPVMADAASTALSGLQTIVQDLAGILADQQDKVAALHELGTAGMREVRVVSARVAALTEAALDAETRLGAGVARADETLRHPSPVDEITALIRRGIDEHSHAIATGLNNVAGRMVAGADGSVQTFRSAVTEAAAHITGLGNTAAGLRRDVAALDSASRAIAVASATVVSQLSGAVSHFDAAVAGLPTAAATVSAAAEQVVHTLAEASAALQADSSAIETSRRESQQAAAAAQHATETLTHRAKDIEIASSKAIFQVAKAVNTVSAALADMPVAVAAITTAADKAAQTLAEASAVSLADGEISGRWIQQAAAATELAAETLARSAKEMEIAGSTTVSQVENTVAMVNAALAEMPAAVAVITATAEQAAQALTEASAVLCAETAAMVATGRDTLEVTTMLQQETQELNAATQAFAETGHQTLATITNAAQMAVTELAVLLADADASRLDAINLAGLTTTLENAAATIVDGAARLDAAGQQVAASGERAVDRINAETARSEAVMRTLPDVVTELTTASVDLRQETTVLSAAAWQMSAAGGAATIAITNMVARAEASAASYDAAGRMARTASDEMAAQIDRLAAIGQHAETQAVLPPDVAAQISDFASYMPVVSSPANVAEIAPDDGDSSAKDMVSEVSGDTTQQAGAEAASSEQDGIWSALTASLSQVQAAAVAVAEAAASERAKPNSAAPFAFDTGNVPPALAATLQHFSEVGCQSEALLRQAEALAEAALTGHAPGLPALLADRTPALLADIEALKQRLQSVGTALAQASDGAPLEQLRVA